MSRPRIRESERAIATATSLDQFLATVAPLPADARYQLLGQAQLLLGGLYVHLQLKRAMYATDPIQRLRLLERRLDSEYEPGSGGATSAVSDLQFHAELAAIFRALRDLHTVYQLPDPYRGNVATLGLLVESYTDSRRRLHYIASKIDPELKDKRFREGVELLAWNGIPIDRAVELNADRQAGSNLEARLARGLEALTLRPLRSSPPPDERWVTVGFRTESGEEYERRLDWLVLAAATGPQGRPHDPVATGSAMLAIDAGNEASRQIKRALFAPQRRVRSAQVDMLHDVLRVDTIERGRRELGYLRIFSFNVTNPQAFVEAISRILQMLPQTGLVIDIRGNPGGHILAAETTLQLLTERPIEPVRFSLTTTPLALALCDAHPDFAPWVSSVEQAVETGETYSQPLPLSAPAELAANLPRYQGPVLLITDALCYSAADIFAAGFQDNELGPILGVASRTGAGGANVWTHDLLRLWLPEQLDQLPADTGFRIALRRVTRVRANEGLPLEDLGVRAETIHRLTKRDITDGNYDLFSAAARLISHSEAAEASRLGTR
jgi:Peptidase family S41